MSWLTAQLLEVLLMFIVKYILVENYYVHAFVETSAVHTPGSYAVAKNPCSNAVDRRWYIYSRSTVPESENTRHLVNCC